MRLGATGTIPAYQAARYTFPTLEEVRAALADDFVERSCAFGDYELGDRCPTLALAPRQG